MTALIDTTAYERASRGEQWEIETEAALHPSNPRR